MLDLPMFGKGMKPEMFAYADIDNNGDQSMSFKAAELIAGDIRLIEEPMLVVSNGMFSAIMDADIMRADEVDPMASSTIFYADQMGEQASGAYVFQMRIPSSVVLPPHSSVSVPFFQPTVMVEPFFGYLSLFSPMNSKGKLFKAYNISSLETFLPAGRLMLHEQGRFIGELDMPGVAAGEVYAMHFGQDADVVYRRHVKILQGNADSDTVTYGVEINFENLKPSRDIFVDCMESFEEYNYFEVTQISMSKDNMPDLVLYGTELRAKFPLQQQGGRKMISYNVTVHKTKPADMTPAQSMVADMIRNAGMTQAKPTLMSADKLKSFSSGMKHAGRVY